MGSSPYPGARHPFLDVKLGHHTQQASTDAWERPFDRAARTDQPTPSDDPHRSPQ